MWRWFVRVVGALLVAASCAVPAYAVPFDDDDPSSKGERTPGFQYGVAILFTLITLIIVCMPTRKGTQ
jgi:hypothetical protein